MTDPREAAAGSMHLSFRFTPGPVLHSYSDIEVRDRDTATICTALSYLSYHVFVFSQACSCCVHGI